MYKNIVKISSLNIHIIKYTYIYIFLFKKVHIEHICKQKELRVGNF